LNGFPAAKPSFVWANAAVGVEHGTAIELHCQYDEHHYRRKEYDQCEYQRDIHQAWIAEPWVAPPDALSTGRSSL
jgi:hypothetical protein